MSTDPTLQFEQGSPRLGQSEISPPASHVAVPIIPQLRTCATAATIPFLANLRLESLHALRCDTDPLLSVQSKAQELAFPHPSLSRSWRRSPSVADASRSRPVP